MTNAALITTLGESAHGVLAQSVGGGGGTGGAGDVSADTSDSGSFGFSGSLTVGGQGGTGSQGGLVTVTNQAGIATQGDSARGIFAQSVGGGGGTAGGGVAKANGKDLSLSVSVGGNGGQGGNGGEVNVMNQSSILTEGADADAIYAQSVGGGGGSAGKGSSTAGGTNSGAEVAANMVVMLSNGLNLGKTVVQKGDKVFQIGDGVLKDVTAINDLRKAIGGTPPPTGVAAAPGADPAPDPAPDPNKDGDATNIAADLTIGGQGGAAGNSAPVKVDNTGSVETDGSRSNGIFAQSVARRRRVGGLTSFSMAVNDKGAGVSVGGSGTGGGNGGEVDVTHEAGATILTQGAAAHGIYAQSVGGGGGKGGLTGSQQGALRNLNLVLGGSGGVGGIGGTVTVDDSARGQDHRRAGLRHLRAERGRRRRHGRRADRRQGRVAGQGGRDPAQHRRQRRIGRRRRHGQPEHDPGHRFQRRLGGGDRRQRQPRRRCAEHRRRRRHLPHVQHPRRAFARPGAA